MLPDPDGRVRREMTLMNMPFEVSWTAEKLEELPRRRNIDPFTAVLILNDERTRLVSVLEPPHTGQERVIGMDERGRLLTIAMNINYPDGDDDVGIIRCHTAWLSTEPERVLFNDGQ